MGPEPNEGHTALPRRGWHQPRTSRALLAERLFIPDAPCIGQGACMFLKRLQKGRFVWPSAKEGKVALTPAQLAMLLEGIDWRAPQRTWRPLAAG